MTSINGVGSVTYQPYTEWYGNVGKIAPSERGTDFSIPSVVPKPGYLPVQRTTTAETIVMAEELRRMFQANDRYCAERLFSQFQDSRGMDCVEDKGNSGYPVPASPNEPFFLKEQRSDGSPGSPTINKSAGGRVINARQDVLKHMFSNAIGTDMIRLNPEGAETLQEQWQWDEKNSCFRQTVFFVSLSQGNNLSVVCGACSRVLS